jgi:hypothetical protein
MMRARDNALRPLTERRTGPYRAGGRQPKWAGLGNITHLNLGAPDLRGFKIIRDDPSAELRGAALRSGGQGAERMFRISPSALAVLIVCGATLGAAGPGLADDANPAALAGHWRKTTIQHLGPRDEHLVLGADGTMADWVVTAESRTAPVSGAWRVDGNVLTITVDGEVTASQPFTFYEGQLVFPNVQNRRGFWTRLAD